MQTERTLINHHVWIVTGLLALLMLLSRPTPVSQLLHLPDASMAIFFLGGFYARRHLSFLGLLALSVAIDWVSIQYMGVSDYCVTAAYGFLLLAYAVLWYGGRMCAHRNLPHVTVFMAASVCAALSFVISNGSFYWLGSRVAIPSMAGWAANFAEWAPLFIGTAVAYVGLVLLAHVAWKYAPRLHLSATR